MAGNPFADLIPAQGGSTHALHASSGAARAAGDANPFSDLIPAHSGDSGNAFSDLIPKPSGLFHWGSGINLTEDALKGAAAVGEPVAEMVTGAPAMLLGGLAGLGAAATRGGAQLVEKLAAPGSQASRTAHQIESLVPDLPTTFADVTNAFTYHPKTSGGKALENLVITRPMHDLDYLANRAGEAVFKHGIELPPELGGPYFGPVLKGSPVAATAVKTAIEMLPFAIAPELRAPVRLAARDIVRTMADRAAKGYESPVLAPSEVIGEAAKGIQQAVESVGRITPEVSEETASGKLAIPEGRGVPDADRPVEAKFRNYIQDHTDEAIARYNKLPDTDGGRIISTDSARELSADYAASNAARGRYSRATHEPASALAKEIYRRKLQEPDPNGLNLVTFMAGGTGAGKTTVIQHLPQAEQIVKNSQIVYDTNMNGFESSVKKIDQALKAGKEAQVFYVYREPVDALINEKGGVIQRARKKGRTVPISEHAATHRGSAETMLRLAQHYRDDPRVNIQVIDNSRGFQKPQMADLSLIDLSRYNGLEERLHQALDQEYRNGRVPQGIYRASKGDDAGGTRPTDGPGDGGSAAPRGPGSGRGGSSGEASAGLPLETPGQGPVSPLDPSRIRESGALDISALGPAADIIRSGAQSATQFATEAKHAVQMAVSPMAAGESRFTAYAKDFANTTRRVQWDFARIWNELSDRFTPEELREMGAALDEHSVHAQMGVEPGPGMGLNRLPDEQRASVEHLNRLSQAIWNEAQAVGLVNGEAIPYYMPRMLVTVGRDGTFAPVGREFSESGRPLFAVGRNLTTARPKHREYLTPEETLGAAQAKFGDETQLVEDIRALPMASARLARAVAGRKLVDAVKEIGKEVGFEPVIESAEPGYFTLDHPAFQVYRPRFERDVATGKIVAAEDASGNIIFDRRPLYVSRHFEGPLRAVLSMPANWLVRFVEDLKARTMGLIMYSPAIHNAVEWGRALPIMPGKVLTFYVYFTGHKFRTQDIPGMQEAIQVGGLVPIGHRFAFQDVSSLMEEPNLKPGRSITARVIGKATDVVSTKAGEKVRRAIDRAGDIWHNTLLWDRVADLQAGIYKNVLEGELKKGVARSTAVRIAAHAANRFAGSLPQEAMSSGLRHFANFALFSRTFTLGNLGVAKDMLTGLPRDVQAQIMRDAGDTLQQAKSRGRRIAIHAISRDIALMVIGNSLLQSALDHWKRGEPTDKLIEGYVTRWKNLIHRSHEHPFEVFTSPIADLEHLSSTQENEPGKEARIFWGTAPDGTAIYVRMPMGKIGEEYENWLISPVQTLKNKEGTIMRPLSQFLTNDMGFGRRLYNPDDTSTLGMIQNVGRIAWNFIAQQYPLDAIQGAWQLLEGKGSESARTTSAFKAFGPLAGLTFSKGAPGGPAVGMMFHTQEERMHRIADLMPEVRRLVDEGHADEAVRKMVAAGMTPGEIKGRLATINVPALRLKRFGKRALEQMTPDEIDRLQQIESARPSGAQP